MASRFWVGGTAAWDGTAGSKWATTSGGAGGAAVPTAADDVFLDGASGAVTVTISTTSGICRSLDCTGFTGSLVHAAGISLFVGDASGGALKFVPGMTYTPNGSASAGIVFRATSTNGGAGWPITTAGKSMGVNGGTIKFNGAGGKWVLQDGFAAAAGCPVTHTDGELDTNNQAVTVSTFVSSGANVRVLTLGTSTITLLTTTSAVVWNPSGSNLTISGASATFVIGSNSANVRTFAGFGATYGTLTYTRSGSTGGLDITGSPTFATLNFSDATNARTLRIAAGATVTITTAFNVNGTSGKLMTITSITAATHTLSKASGTVTCDFCSIDHSVASGGASWNATNSTDGGSNSGWSFAAAPPDTGFFAVL